MDFIEIFAFREDFTKCRITKINYLKDRDGPGTRADRGPGKPRPRRRKRPRAEIVRQRVTAAVDRHDDAATALYVHSAAANARSRIVDLMR
jgi:hypothetical protein